MIKSILEKTSAIKSDSKFLKKIDVKQTIVNDINPLNSGTEDWRAASCRALINDATQRLKVPSRLKIQNKITTSGFTSNNLLALRVKPQHNKSSIREIAMLKISCSLVRISLKSRLIAFLGKSLNVLSLRPKLIIIEENCTRASVVSSAPSSSAGRMFVNANIFRTDKPDPKNTAITNNDTIEYFPKFGKS